MVLFLVSVFILLFSPLFCDNIDEIWKKVSESEGKIQIVNDLMSNLAFNQNTSETTHSQRKVIYLFIFTKKEL